MANILEDVRRVVPRWRSFATTAQLGELGGVQKSAIALVGPADGFAEKVADWVKEHSIGTAADLVGSAIVLGRHQEVEDAARFLLASTAKDAVRREAAQALEGVRPSFDEELPTNLGIARLRRRLRDQPRNAIAWAELARLHANSGNRKKARAAMQVAVSLVRANRFVLRSAARLYVHLGDPDEALWILEKRSATAVDPWLLAAAIASASVAGTTSRHVKKGGSLLGDAKHSALQTSELAAALGSLELEAGSNKRARRLFRQSLVEATDNAVAQAHWASRHVEQLHVSPNDLQVPFAFEALTREHAMKAEWQLALDRCRDWQLDEPFSSRAAMAGSYFALTAIDDASIAETFARAGLVSNPGDAGLLNNLVVALVEQERLDEAESYFSRIPRVGLEKPVETVVTATEGMLHFRRGRPDDGRTSYLKAIKLADERQAVLAHAHLLREEFLGGRLTPADLVDGLPRGGLLDRHPDISAFVERLRGQAGQPALLDDKRGPA